MGYISEKYCIPSGTVVSMIKDGIVDWRIEGLHDFWVFYNKLLSTRTPGEVKEEMMLQYKIKNKITYYRMIKKARQIFE